MVEVRMRYEHQVDRWKIDNSYAWLADPLEKKKPSREIRIDRDVLAAHLHEECRVPNECHSKFAVGD